MRLIYVAATRAQDRLILSGTSKDIDRLGTKSDTWLNWIWQTLELPAPTRSGIVNLEDQDPQQNTGVELILNVANQFEASPSPAAAESADQPNQPSEGLTVETPAEGLGSLSQVFPLMRPVEPARERVVHRFSVTQLINYQRCARQYYFDRVLHVPAADEMAVSSDSAPPVL
jgi:ATP-dependent exoDNAse (exonuclease V) beta subunit